MNAGSAVKASVSSWLLHFLIPGCLSSGMTERDDNDSISTYFGYFQQKNLSVDVEHHLFMIRKRHSSELIVSKLKQEGSSSI